MQEIKDDRFRGTRPLGCLTPAEAADKIGTSSVLVRKWIHKGKLLAARAENGFFWIRESDLDKLQKQNLKNLVFTNQAKSHVLQRSQRV